MLVKLRLCRVPTDFVIALVDASVQALILRPVDLALLRRPILLIKVVFLFVRCLRRATRAGATKHEEVREPVA